MESRIGCITFSLALSFSPFVFRSFYFMWHALVRDTREYAFLTMFSQQREHRGALFSFLLHFPRLWYENEADMELIRYYVQCIYNTLLAEWLHVFYTSRYPKRNVIDYLEAFFFFPFNSLIVYTVYVIRDYHKHDRSLNWAHTYTTSERPGNSMPCDGVMRLQWKLPYNDRRNQRTISHATSIAF